MRESLYQKDSDIFRRFNKVKFCSTCDETGCPQPRWHHVISVLQAAASQKCYHMTRIFQPRTKTNDPWSEPKKALVHGRLRWIVTEAHFFKITFDKNARVLERSLIVSLQEETLTDNALCTTFLLIDTNTNFLSLLPTQTGVINCYDWLRTLNKVS